MISIKKAFFVLVILLAFQIEVLSQSLIVDLRVGAAGFRGETSKGAALLEELGQDFSLKAYRLFNKSKWQLSGEFSYSHTKIELDLASKNNTNLANYKATAIHYYLGAGARYMLNEDIEVIEDIKFNKAQFLPYLDISVGLLNFRNSTNQEATTISGYKTAEDMMWGLTGQLELGINLMLRENIGIGAFSTLRTGFSDLWDGIEGTTNVNDWQVRAGLQVSFAIE